MLIMIVDFFILEPKHLFSFCFFSCVHSRSENLAFINHLYHHLYSRGVFPVVSSLVSCHEVINHACSFINVYLSKKDSGKSFAKISVLQSMRLCKSYSETTCMGTIFF